MRYSERVERDSSITAYPLLPESPRWLVANGYNCHTDASIRHLMTPEELQNCLAKKHGMNRDHNNSWRAVLCPQDETYKSMIRIAFRVAISSQAVGIEAVTYYVTVSLIDEGLSYVTASWITVGMGVCKVLSVCVCLLTTDIVGRKPLMKLSCLGMGFAMTMFSLFSFINAYVWLKVASLAISLSAFSIGMGPMAYCYVAEAYPGNVRARGMAVAHATTRLMSSAVAMSYLTLCDVFGRGVVHLFYGIVSFALFFFIQAKVPETNGLILEEMNAAFAGVIGRQENEQNEAHVN